MEINVRFQNALEERKSNIESGREWPALLLALGNQERRSSERCKPSLKEKDFPAGLLWEVVWGPDVLIGGRPAEDAQEEKLQSRVGGGRSTRL